MRLWTGARAEEARHRCHNSRSPHRVTSRACNHSLTSCTNDAAAIAHSTCCCPATAGILVAASSLKGQNGALWCAEPLVASLSPLLDSIAPLDSPRCTASAVKQLHRHGSPTAPFGRLCRGQAFSATMLLVVEVLPETAVAQSAHISILV